MDAPFKNRCYGSLLKVDDLIRRLRPGEERHNRLINKGRFTLQEFDDHVITIFGSYFIVEIEYNFLIIFQCGDRGVCHGGHPHD